jgi:hypothetical protein
LQKREWRAGQKDAGSISLNWQNKPGYEKHLSQGNIPPLPTSFDTDENLLPEKISEKLLTLLNEVVSEI